MDKKGFTLIELLVAITIVGILSTIGLTMYQNSQKAGRDAKRKQDLQTIAEALEQRKGISGSYTAPAICQDIRSDSANWNSTSCGLTNYLKYLSQDPQNSGNFRYRLCVEVDGGKFVLSASLELGSDQGDPPGIVDPAITSCTPGGSIRYWIKSRQ